MNDCNEERRRDGLDYPRTCARCGLGPCPEIKANGLVITVPTEVYLAYEDRARSIAEQYAPNAAPAAKVAILKFALEARQSGTASVPSDPA